MRIIASREYAALKRAFNDVASARRLTPSDVQVLVFLAEHGNPIRSDHLEAALFVHPSGIRRSLIILYARGFAFGTAEDGGRRRQGVRSIVEITLAGRGVADDASRRVVELLQIEEAT